MPNFKKYFLLKNGEIIKSNTFKRPSTTITPIEDSDYIYKIENYLGHNHFFLQEADTEDALVLFDALRVESRKKFDETLNQAVLDAISNIQTKQFNFNTVLNLSTILDLSPGQFDDIYVPQIHKDDDDDE